MGRPILLVEDSADDAELFVKLLRKARITNRIVQVRTAEQAMQYLAGEIPYGDRANFPMPGIVMLDLKLPDQDGFAVLEWIRQRQQFRNLLLVVLTQSESIFAVRRAYELGANTFLVKPCTEVDLENLVHAFSYYWERSPIATLTPAGGG